MKHHLLDGQGALRGCPSRCHRGHHSCIHDEVGAAVLFLLVRSSSFLCEPCTPHHLVLLVLDRLPVGAREDTEHSNKGSSRFAASGSRLDIQCRMKSVPAIMTTMATGRHLASLSLTHAILRSQQLQTQKRTCNLYPRATPTPHASNPRSIPASSRK